MNIPIITTITGDPMTHFAPLVEHNKKYNEVIVIDDNTNLDYVPGLNDLHDNYEHMSTNEEWYEKYCLSRWFLIRHYMTLHQIEVALCCDHDVLVFVNTAKDWDMNYRTYMATINRGNAVQSSYFTYYGICKFCDLITEAYCDKQSDTHKELINRGMFYKEQEMEGGVSDMDLAQIFYQRQPDLIAESMHLTPYVDNHIKNCMMDHNFQSDEGGRFKMDAGLKDVVWSNLAKLPVSVENAYEKPIFFKTLNFQGQSKYCLIDWLEKFYK